MKKLLIGVALTALLTAPALAADIPARMPVKAPPPVVQTVYNWSGLYIGAHGGYAWGDADWGFPFDGTFVSHDVDGGIFGGHAGFNFQWNQLVLGVEVAGSWTGLDGSSLCPNPAFVCRTEFDRMFRAGGRAGLALNNWLIYATGGYANVRVDTDTTPVFFGFGDTDNHRGWYAGGGVEYGVTQNLIIGVEGFRVSLDSRTHAPAGGLTITRNVDPDFSVIQGRISWKFGPWGAPVVARY